MGNSRHNEFGLTEIQELFCHKYLLCDFNGARAAIAAGSQSDNPSQVAYNWLQMPKINERLAQLITARSNRLDIGADYVLKRLVEIDQMDVIDIFNAEMKGFKPLDQWPSAWRQFLSAVDLAEITEGYGDDKAVVGVLKKIKWPDKTKNLELIGKHVDVQAFKERVTHDGKVSATLDDEGLQVVRERLDDILSGGAKTTH